MPEGLRGIIFGETGNYVHLCLNDYDHPVGNPYSTHCQ